MADPTGIVHDVHRSLAQDLFSPLSTLYQLLSLARANGLNASRGVRICRALVLRLSASFKFRFCGTFHENPMQLFHMLNETHDQQLERVRKYVEPAEHEKVCPKCTGKIIVILTARVNAKPILSLESKRQVFVDILESVA